MELQMMSSALAVPTPLSDVKLGGEPAYGTSSENPPPPGSGRPYPGPGWPCPAGLAPRQTIPGNLPKRPRTAEGLKLNNTTEKDKRKKSE